MASKFQASDDFDDQFLTCPVCVLHFRDPRILPCLHTFCKGCLEEWVTKQQPLECPTCRTQVSLPDQGVDGLRANFYVNNLLDFAAAKKGAEPGVPCQVCEGNMEGSKSWCADCAMLMCDSCTLLHRKFPSSKDHEVTTEETLKAEEGRSKFHRKRHCDKHKKYELEFYCEVCKTLVCTACTVVDHRPGKDHNLVEIATVAQRKKDTLQGLLQDIDPRLKEIEASVKEVERNMSNLMPSREEATNQANAYFNKLVDLLREREKQFVIQIDEQCRADGKALQTKKEAIEFELVGLTSARTFCQQAVEHGSDVHVVEPDCMKHPLGVAVLQDGRMVVADNKQKSCLLLQPDGSLIREIGKGQLRSPYFVSVDESRDVLFVTDNSAHKVFAFNLGGKLLFDFGKQGDNDGEMKNPHCVRVDPAGNVIVGNAGDGRVQVFRPDRTFKQKVATVEGGYASGIALTPDGNIVVACSQGHCMEIYMYK
ncbi:tripartite motif-containing protein 3-like [Branchiostoma floridae]|uniref:RING-type E3 ubiquitin transferase n=1 Tax=Branchiostoma floridae TaxID=7739 RepID=A0A9J7MSD8_BRAFL|nr:tripartite motif-containing protein 3-like [Branchiostoma floridae]